jgi:putative two-component system response regulator
MTARNHLNPQSAIRNLQSVRPARILISDDDPGTRELLTAMVEGLGHEAIAVPDGGAALAAIAERPPDLVLSDVSMPGLNGFELCRRLKADPRTRLIPVVLITGIGEEFKLQAIETGADDFFVKPFTPADLRVRIRVALRTKAFTDELESAEAVLCTLAKSIEAKDPYTEGHCERLAEYAVSLGRALGVGEEDLTALRWGGYLHDLGKVAVPETILLKAGLLTPEERAIMQKHPLVGEEICKPLASLQAVLPIIRHHHENQNGSGYPDGLRGEAVLLTARILRVVDVYDALTTDSPYHRALSEVAALEILDTEVQKGWLDPDVVRAFGAVLAEVFQQSKGGTSTMKQILVLAIEDDPVNQEVVTAFLESEGCRILIAATAQEGLSLATAERPDLILMDVELPGMTGYDATRRLKADPATAGIPVVAFTAQAMRGEDEKAKAAGCDAYITKPLEPEVFRQTLRRFLSDKGKA